MIEVNLNTGEQAIRAKGTMDGATTLPECAEKLREYANELEALVRDGWELSDLVVVGDYARISEASLIGA